MSQQFVIVVWDDSDHIFPMAWDSDCEGAICCASSSCDIAQFEDAKAARKAIRISTAFAKLRSEQGKTYNSDFIAANLKNVKIRRLKAKS